jgi:hypothetical protein
MSPQDSQMLHDFLSQLIQARGIQKDPEADALIQRAVAQQPDAAYLLVQRALLLEQALNNAKDRIAGLESQVRSGQQGDGGKFLDANSWGNSGRSQPAQSYQRDTQQPYQSQPQYQPPYQPQPQYQSAPSSGFLRGGFGGTLGSIAATAAGVAAGGFLFQGLENMFSHHDHGGGNRLLNSDDPSNNLFNDQSGSSLADQAGLGDVDRVLDNGASSEGLFDSSVDNGSIDGGQGFFDGDGSDEGLFS